MIDASIYSQLKNFEVPSYSEAKQRALTLKELGLRNKKLQRGIDNEEAVQAAYAKNTGPDGSLDQKLFLADIGKASPELALQYGEQFAKRDAANSDRAIKGAEAAQKRSLFVGRALEGLAGLPEEQRAQAYPAIRSQLIQSGAITQADAPDAYDQVYFNNALKQYQGSGEYLDQKYKQAQIQKFADDKSLEQQKMAAAERQKAAELTGNAELLQLRGKQSLQQIAAKGEQDRLTNGAKNPLASVGKKAFERLPMDKQHQITKLADSQANLVSINNELKAAYSQLNDPNLSDDDKVKVGQGLLKTLNSTQGKDAVGADEAKRLGNYLEYKILNLTQPGSVFGRDLDQFARQVAITSNKLDKSQSLNDEVIQGLYSGEDMRPPAIALSPNRDGPKNGVINSAQASKQWDSVETNPRYFEALKWARANPNDPKAAQILQKLKGGR